MASSLSGSQAVAAGIITYETLLEASQEKSRGLFNDWTKAGKYQMVAGEIFRRLDEIQDITPLAKQKRAILLRILNTEVLPNVDGEFQLSIYLKLDSMPEHALECSKLKSIDMSQVRHILKLAAQEIQSHRPTALVLRLKNS